MKTLSVVYCDTTGKQDKTVEYTLENIQALVKGYIETVPLHGKLLLICNEEGKLIDGAVPTVMLVDKKGKVIDTIYQPCFITRFGKDDFRSVTDSDKEWIDKHYSFNENKNIGVLRV